MVGCTTMHSTFPVCEVCTSYIFSRLKMLLHLTFWIITGIMAEDPPVIHYGLLNSSVCFHVRKPSANVSAQWMFAGTAIIGQAKINPAYKERVVYSPVNYSLCINKLNISDAGLYEATLTYPDFQVVKEIHRVIIQEMVPRPVMIISELGSNLSAGLCSFTINCSIRDVWVWSVCENDSCRTSQRSFSKVNITIFTDSRTVTCSGNNHVSTNNVSLSIMKCSSESDPEDIETPQKVIPWELFFITLAIPLVCFLFLVKRLFSEQCNQHQAQSSSVRLIQSQSMETPPPSQARASITSSSSDAEPNYENVDITELSQTVWAREEMISQESHKVDTIYSVPKARASSCKNTQKALTSESVTPDETQHPTQADTVYSMLQKPKQMNTQHHP